jgi:hypothetical protein
LNTTSIFIEGRVPNLLSYCTTTAALYLQKQGETVLSEFPVTVNDSGRALPVDFEFPPFFSFSTALGSALSFCKDNAPFLHKVVFAFYLPFLVPEYLLSATGVGGFLVPVLAIFSFLAKPMMTGALIYGAIHWYRTGANPPLSEVFRWGLKKWWPICVTLILSTIATFAGMILLIIPGIILSLMFSISSEVAAVEDIGPIDAMKRSIALTKGYRWSIWGTYFVAGFITGAVSLLAGSSLITGGSHPILASLMVAIIKGLLEGFNIVLALVIYLGIISARNLEASYPSEPALAIAAER